MTDGYRDAAGSPGPAGRDGMPACRCGDLCKVQLVSARNAATGASVTMAPIPGLRGGRDARLSHNTAPTYARSSARR